MFLGGKAGGKGVSCLAFVGFCWFALVLFFWVVGVFCIFCVGLRVVVVFV